MIALRLLPGHATVMRAPVAWLPVETFSGAKFVAPVDLKDVHSVRAKVCIPDHEAQLRGQLTKEGRCILCVGTTRRHGLRGEKGYQLPRLDENIAVVDTERHVIEGGNDRALARCWVPAIEEKYHGR